MQPNKADTSVVFATDNGYRGEKVSPSPIMLCRERAPLAACDRRHMCTLPAGHRGPHRSEDFGCAWPTVSA